MPWQRKLGRATDQRTSILRNLVTALILNGKIETTEARANNHNMIALAFYLTHALPLIA